MNIEKIKIYNQKLLAVIGSMVVLAVSIGIISLAVFTFLEFIGSFNHSNVKEGILSDKKIAELKKENKRQQIISYETPQLVDTANLVYMIPVTQKTLGSPEYIRQELLGLMDSYESDYTVDSRYSNQYYGDFNNLLIYDYKNKEVIKLFNDRINFENIGTTYFQDDILILFKAAALDTYKDGVINQQDKKSIFIFSLKTKELREIEEKNADAVSYTFVQNTKDLILKFGIDHNKDGKFDQYTEPSMIKRYDYEKDELRDIISSELNNALQEKLEGTE